MPTNEDDKTRDYPHHTEQTDNAPAGGYEVKDDDNLDEKDLTRSFLFGSSHDDNPNQPGFESEGMGGQEFGQNNVTRSGDDLANPSRTAGYSNSYFARTEPLEEHPDNQNFKPTNQEGQPDMNEGKEEVAGYREAPDQQKVGGVDPKEGGDQSTNSTGEQQYQEGTADNDGDQQKTGQDESDTPGTAYYKPEDDAGKPSYGNDSPDGDK